MRSRRAGSARSRRLQTDFGGSPKLYPVKEVHPISRLAFRRKNVEQFVIIYAYIEPTARRPEGLVNIRAIRHGAKEDGLFRVEESRATAGWEFPPLRAGHHARDACWRGDPVDYGTAADATPYRTRGATRASDVSAETQ